jgi:hypothetical protein
MMDRWHRENEMKSMTCRELGGACDLEFRANTFEEMAELSRNHGMEMRQTQDAAHLEAMQEMKNLMQNPGDMEKWYESKRQEFEALPES